MVAPKPDAKPVAVIMAGGGGTRFWPLSTPARPKQFLALGQSRSLIQQTVDRLHPLLSSEQIFICAHADQKPLLREQLPDVTNLILEPMAKNTAACLMLSVTELLARGHAPTTPMVVLPADHYFVDNARFREVLTGAISIAETTQGLVTLGIRADSPHTGYGYIEAGEKMSDRPAAHRIRRFVEKPDAARAKEFLLSGNFYWNSGIFVWTLGAIVDAFKKFQPESWQKLADARGAESTVAVYAQLPALPIDVAVMEKAANGYVLPVDLAWSDLGSWDAVAKLFGRPNENTALAGDLSSIDSKNCLVNAEGVQVALIGVEDLHVVFHENKLLVCRRGEDQKVKQAAAALSKIHNKSK